MKVQVNLSLTEEVRDLLDALAMADRKLTGSEMNRSMMVEALVNAAHAAAQPQKRIEPIRAGKKLVGWRAMYGDHTVGEFDLMDKPAAQLALDAYAYEELSPRPSNDAEDRYNRS